MTNFQAFKRGPAGRICGRAGLDITDLPNWREFTKAFQSLNEREGNRLVETFQQMKGGTGDKAIVQAILHAADYSREADEMSDALELKTWSRLQYVTGDYAEAVAAAILRRDFGNGSPFAEPTQLNKAEALALAQMTKRMIIEWIRPFSADEEEAQRMWDALCKIRQTLAKAGVAPP